VLSVPNDPGGKRLGSIVGGEIVPAGGDTPAFGALRPVVVLLMFVPLVVVVVLFVPVVGVVVVLFVPVGVVVLSVPNEPGGKRLGSIVGGEMVPAGGATPASGATRPDDVELSLVPLVAALVVVLFVPDAVLVVPALFVVLSVGVVVSSFPNDPGGRRLGSIVGGEIVPAGGATPAFGAISPVPD
jgi:hypothetical protein